MSNDTGTAKKRRISRRKWLAICGGGLAMGVAGAALVPRKKPDLPLSIGKLQAGAEAPATCRNDWWTDLDDLGIRHMSQFDRLPWFEKDDSGQFRLRADAGVDAIIDTHSHVGWAFGLAKSVDMTRTCKVEYFYDFEREQDLLCTQIHPTPDEAARMRNDDLAVFLKTPHINRTQTAANLAAEMDRMNFRSAVLLPIAVPFHERHARDTFDASSMDKRFIALGAVYPKPWGPRKIAEIERQVKIHGIKGIKYHPVFQLLAPDDPDMMRLFEWCEAHGLLVYAHTGYTGREPRFMKEKSEPRRFEKPLEAFPNLRMVFAHTGVRRVDEALSVARKFDDRVWLDISGQAAPAIAYILRRYDTAKIMFGSDWPFYPLSVMVARSLVATESCPSLRERFFSGNAKALLGLA
ncbi:MAG TPA: amidohydrolase family protein [Candidatus Hydrogenedentes bacterium]|nr:amidohydrolase family protein [Candidatus Hydrogenedentota bacterium]HRT18881.1 amidohydrolase family protein [Candidatus Hydrogenedentota bacterium]HRT65606.1 amidohydrolase family protein [Candidatus Hydrogenedentota bacterium]